jgi:hypothetical protein
MKRFKAAHQQREKKELKKWNKSIRKDSRLKGEEYVTIKGKSIPAKKFNDYVCSCKCACHKINLQDRQKFYELYYNADTWEAQNSIIVGAVKCESITRRHTENKEHCKRQCSRSFLLPMPGGDVKICKNMFMKTMQIDSARIHRALCKAKSSKLCDLRGKHVPHNKTLPTAIDIIHDHIKNFPTIVSHYTRKDTNKLYLDTNLNLSLMYRHFVEFIKQKGTLQKVPSQSLYEKIFRRDFNLSFKPPRKDTCHTCDSLKNSDTSSRASNDANQLCTLKVKQELHHCKVQLARDSLKSDENLSQTENGPTVISFDLQKVMPLPKLTTGIGYYKRQVSCYNLGIHNFSSKTGTMHVWDESIASRGAQEVGSCILKYL